MEFRRIEIRRSLRYRELISDHKETREILGKLKEKSLKFSMKAKNIGPLMEKCIVQAMGENDLTLFSNYPIKIRTTVPFDEIEMLEVESNCNFLAEEPDSGGRWARIM
jgi:hypothetical protein